MVDAVYILRVRVKFPPARRIKNAVKQRKIFVQAKKSIVNRFKILH